MEDSIKSGFTLSQIGEFAFTEQTGITAITIPTGVKMDNAIGIPEEQLRQAARLAVCKINIDSDLRLGMTAGVRTVFSENPAAFDPREYLKVGRKNVKDIVAHKIKDVLGSEGAAL